MFFQDTALSLGPSLAHPLTCSLAANLFARNVCVCIKAAQRSAGSPPLQAWWRRLQPCFACVGLLRQNSTISEKHATGSESCPTARQCKVFARLESRGRRGRRSVVFSWASRILCARFLNCVGVDARTAACRFCGRRLIVARKVQISWQVQHCCKVKCIFRGRRLSTDYVAGAALSGSADMSAGGCVASCASAL